MKILVITNNNYHYKGGVETYNKKLYTLFRDVTFFEYPVIDSPITNKEILNVNGVILSNFSYIDKYKNSKLISKNLKCFIKKNKIDLIIMSGNYFFDKEFFKKHKKKIIFIQHTIPYHYINGYSFDKNENRWIVKKNNTTNKLKSLIRSFFHLNIKDFIYKIKYNNWNNFLHYLDYVVVYTSYDKEIFEKYYENKTFFEVPLCANFNYLKNKKIYDFISPIRNSWEKNPNKILEISKDFPDKKFLIIGSSFKNKVINNVTYSSSVNHDKLQELISKSNFLLMSSLYEGFSFSCVESLSQGVPIIIADNYPSAKFLTGDKERGLQYNINDHSNEEIKMYIKNIKYNDVSKKCISFYEENLTDEKFSENWSNIFNFFNKTIK